jgi:hypothetical protein
MRNAPTAQELSRIPGLYATEKTPAREKVIHMHFFLGSSDWLAVEYDGEDLFFGFVILNDDLANAEWGYFSLAELASFNFLGFQIERDVHWKPVRIGEIEFLRELV